MLVSRRGTEELEGGCDVATCTGGWMKFKLVRECGLDGGGAGSILRAICFAAGVWLFEDRELS